MRISVTEFPRITTGNGWCYLRPGMWISDGWKLEAHRDEHYPEIFNIYDTKKGKWLDPIEYWAGPTSRDVRAKNKRTIAKERKERKELKK